MLVSILLIELVLGVDETFAGFVSLEGVCIVGLVGMYLLVDDVDLVSV